EHVWREPPRIYASLDPSAKAVLAEFPMASEEAGAWFDARYVYFFSFHWKNLVNGYSGFFPPSYLEPVSPARDFPSDRAIDYLRSRGVNYIAVHGAFYAPERYHTIVAELDRKSGIQLASTVAWQGSESRLYRLQQ